MDTPSWDDTQPLEQQAAPQAASTVLPSQGNAQVPQQGMQPPSWDDTFDPEEKYSTLGQQAKTAVEGLGEGFAGPVMPAIERGLGVKTEDIRGREEANPILKGVSKAGGLAGGLLTGTGEAAVMGRVGEAALEVSGLANIAKDAALATRVGSSAVQQAAEMAVLSSGDEISKMILQDPEASAESAISNIGMAAALGAAGGAFVTGAVSPLWKATAGPKVEMMLNGLKDHLDGVAAVLPEQTSSALTTLGIEAPAEIRAVLSGNPTAIDRFNILKETQNNKIIESLDKFRTDASNSVMESLNIKPSAVSEYSENEAGHSLLETFKKEYKEKYEPIVEKLNKRDAEAATIPMGDDARLKAYGNLLESGMNKFGTDSPYYKEYETYAQRLLAKNDLGGLDKLKTEINGRIQGLKMGGDYNTINALNEIKTALTDFQESQIAKAASIKDAEALIRNERIGIKGVDKSASEASAKMLNERAETNRLYKEFAGMSDELTNHLGVGDFRGAGRLGIKLTDKLSPEQVLNKFSIRNNSDFTGFLEKNFPETLKHVQENELKRILKPAILSAKGGEEVNIKKLSDIISKGMSGKADYIKAIIPQEALQRIEAAKMLDAAIPNPKSSGTAGWLTKVTKHVPASALAAVAMVVGHNPVFGYLAGELGQHLGRTAPDAMSLAYLRFLGSSQPVKAEGFKAMADFLHNTYKGQNFINQGVKDVFSAGAKVLGTSILPAKADTEKLDKIVTKLQDTPGKIFADAQNGHVGHYLPDQQAGLSQVSARAVQYLQSVKPQPFRSSPLDRPIEPSKSEMNRYNRALQIAQAPAIVLHHIKEGTLQQSDMQDLGAMYPGLYKTMAAKLSNEMVSKHADGSPIPYKTRMGLSLFLGQPLDSSMTPQSIMASQSIYSAKPKIGSAMDAQKAPKGNLDKLGKENKAYMTPLQAAESHAESRRKS